MDVAQEASAPPCAAPFLHGRELFPCCDYLPRTARGGLPMAMVCNKKSRYMFDVLRSSPDVFARCRLAVLMSPMDSTPSTPAVCSLFCAAHPRRRRKPW
jgi:hypothetical protein